MDIVRNFINISGITADELPTEIKGQIIQYSETDTIFIPENRASVQSVFQITIQLVTKSSRTISTPLGSTVVIDGLKNLKIVYMESGDTGKASMVDLDLPFNTFIEIPKNMLFSEQVNIYILDAYFSLIDSRKIYSHILYLINVNCDLLKEDDNDSKFLPSLNASKIEEFSNSLVPTLLAQETSTERCESLTLPEEIPTRLFSRSFHGKPP